MNISLDETFEKMPILEEDNYKDCLDDTDPAAPLNATKRPFYVSSDSEEVQSAPELDAVQRKIDNARLYPLEVKLYWTYEEVERGKAKKECKRRIDMHKLNRKKYVNGSENNPFQIKNVPKHEVGYDADDEI